MRALKRLRIWGFSVAELFVVAVILTMIAGSAVPRLSRGADGLAESSLAGDLAVVRNGLDLYASDHRGHFPSPATFDAQMTEYSDASGNTSTVHDAAHPFGPYLRKVPVLPVGPGDVRGASTVVETGSSLPGAWQYNPRTGAVHVNLTDTWVDSAGKRYNQY